jgi:L-rhamnose mutarotase
MRAKDFVPASKPRNFVAKNQKTAGAGAHKDKKRAEKQGDVKHKAKQYDQGMAEGAVITKDQLVDIYIKGKGKNNMPIQKKVGAQIPNGKVNSFIAKVAEKYGLNPNAFVYGPSQTAEGWKSKVAGAALAGAAALGGGGAQASEPVTPLAVMATIKMKLPDGSIKTIKKDLGHSYDYRLDDARKDLENVLDRKGIKNYTIHLDRYNAGDANSTAPEKTKNYMDKTPSIGKADDNKNYMDKGPYTSKPSKTTYLDKSTGKEFRDMNNY